MVRPAFNVGQLTVAERLELIDALWESLRSNPQHLPLSDEELALIEERRAAHARQPETATQWEEVRARLHADQEADERAAEAATRRGCALLHRFPYSLTYEILQGGDLVVLACRHVRQDEVNLQARRPDV